MKAIEDISVFVGPIPPALALTKRDKADDGRWRWAADLRNGKVELKRDDKLTRMDRDSTVLVEPEQVVVGIAPVLQVGSAALNPPVVWPLEEALHLLRS